MSRVKSPGRRDVPAGEILEYGPGVLHVLEDERGWAKAFWWLHRPDPDGVRLSDKAVRLFTHLAGWYGGCKSIYPGQAKLAADLGWEDPQMVKRAIRELREWHGLLSVRRLRYEDGPRKGQYRNNTYALYNRFCPPWDPDGELYPWGHPEKFRPRKGGGAAAALGQS